MPIIGSKGGGSVGGLGGIGGGAAASPYNIDFLVIASGGAGWHRLKLCEIKWQRRDYWQRSRTCHEHLRRGGLCR